MKKILAMVLSLTMCLGVLTACGSSNGGTSAGGTSANGTSAGAASGDTLKVGLLGPYTGEVAQYGIAVYNGAELYIKQVNADGGINGKQIEIVKYDEKGDATEAVNAYQKMVEDGVVGIVGDVTSTPSAAVAQESANDNMPMVTASATAANIITYGSNTFRACVTDPFQGKKMADFAEEMGYKKVATVFDSGNDYSIGCQKAFEEECKAKNIEVVKSEGYATGDVDFNAQLTSVISANADAVFCPNYYQDIGKIVTQARQLGYKGAFLGADGWAGIVGGEQDYASTADLHDCYYCSSFSTSVKSAADFVKAYTDSYNAAPTNFNALGYDAAMVLVSGLKTAEKSGKEAGSDEYKQATIDAIAASKIKGVTGSISYAGTGDPVKSVVILTFNDKGETFYKNF